MGEEQPGGYLGDSLFRNAAGYTTTNNDSILKNLDEPNGVGNNFWADFRNDFSYNAWSSAAHGKRFGSRPSSPSRRRRACRPAVRPGSAYA